MAAHGSFGLGARSAARGRCVALSRLLSGVFWLGIYLAVVLMPVLRMLVPPLPPGRGFWLEMSVTLGDLNQAAAADLNATVEWGSVLGRRPAWSHNTLKYPRFSAENELNIFGRPENLVGGADRMGSQMLQSANRREFGNAYQISMV